VLVARGARPVGSIGRILLCYDGSDHARRAAALTTELAPRLGAEVHVLTVTDTPVTGADPAQVAAGLAASGVAAGAHVRPGDRRHPGAALLEAADQLDADLLVAGTRGRSALASLLLGSVTHRLLQLAGCPVLVTR